MEKEWKILKDLFENLSQKYAFFGAGVYAFSRLGPEEFIKDYRIICLRDSLENKIIEKNVEILCLEKDWKYHLNQPRNATTILKNKKTLNFIKDKSRKRRPVILVYKTSYAMERICKENGFILAQAPKKFGKKLFDNKIVFKQILRKLKVPGPEFEILRPEDFKTKYSRLSSSFGLPFLIQIPSKGGGKGNFLIKDKKDFDNFVREVEIEKNPQVLISQYIKGLSPSLTGCITRFGTIRTNLQLQLLDLKESYNLETKKGFGRFCGHDWTSSNFNDNVEKQAELITKKIGDYFKSKGYRGIFGLDFVLDESRNKLYCVEANPRFLGSFPTLFFVQRREGEIPIIAFHILEYLKLNKEEMRIYEDLWEKMNQKGFKNKKIGAQIFIHNKEGDYARNLEELRPGIYKISQKSKVKNQRLKRKTQKLEFLRDGYKLSHLRSKNEFLISDGVPKKNCYFSRNGRILRVLTLREVSKDGFTLTPWAKNVCSILYRSLKLEASGLFWLKSKILRIFFNRRLV